MSLPLKSNIFWICFLFAYLKRLIGSTESSTIKESLTYNLITTGVTAISVNTETFKTKISTSGTYNFIYTPTITYSSSLVDNLNKDSTSIPSSGYSFNDELNTIKGKYTDYLGGYTTALGDLQTTIGTIMDTMREYTTPGNFFSV